MGGRLARYRVPAAFWVAMTSLLLVLQHISSTVLRAAHYTLTWRGLRWYLDGWSQFDGPEYLRIARLGYSYTPGHRSNIVWFPLYPLLVRWVRPLVGDDLVTGVLVSAVAGLAAALLLWAWLRRQGLSGSARRWAFLALMLYPYGWYLYGVVHSDALFLALTLGAFLLVERDRLVWAGVVGALATATRPTGFALIPALVVLALDRGGALAVPEWGPGWIRRFRVPLSVDRGALRWRHLAPLLSVAGVGTYSIYLWVRWGDPILYATNERLYHPGGMPLLKLAFLVDVRDIALHPTYTLTVIGQALVALAVIASVPFVGRRFGWGYGVFVAVLVAIPTVSTENFMGTGRYLIAAFPAFALAGERCSELRWGRWAVALGGVVMVALSMGFSRSWYLT